MADSNTVKNIERIRTFRFDPQSDSRYCLAGLTSLDAAFEGLGEKIAGLIEDRTIEESKSRKIRACNIGGCTLRVIDDNEMGRSFRGECRAATYCLKQTFESVGTAPSVEEGRKIHRDIMCSLDGFACKTSAGNYCPRLDCGLSAGVSIDMVPGTDGICQQEIQPSLPLE